MFRSSVGLAKLKTVVLEMSLCYTSMAEAEPLNYWAVFEGASLPLEGGHSVRKLEPTSCALQAIHRPLDLWEAPTGRKTNANLGREPDTWNGDKMASVVRLGFRQFDRLQDRTNTQESSASYRSGRPGMSWQGAVFSSSSPFLSFFSSHLSSSLLVSSLLEEPLYGR